MRDPENPTYGGLGNISEESFEEIMGISEEEARTGPNLGIVVLQPYEGLVDKQRAVEDGLILLLYNDTPHEECDGQCDTRPLLYGRFSYSKALNLAQALIGLAVPMVPLTSEEQEVKDKIRAIVADHMEAYENRISLPETDKNSGGFNVI